MVIGFDQFRLHFAGLENEYVIIGGAACELLLDEAELSFRTSLDIDMVLCVEVVSAKFCEAFKIFLDAGGYEARERSDGKKEFYRFHRPKNSNYPDMIELFSRNPGTLSALSKVVAPVPVAENLISLSAILLEEPYYHALRNATRQLDGITVIDETLLIPLKARATMNLIEQKVPGKSSDIRKHRNDVFRLTQLLDSNVHIEMPEKIQEDLRRFLKWVEQEGIDNLTHFRVQLTLEEAISTIRAAYKLK